MAGKTGVKNLTYTQLYDLHGLKSIMNLQDRNTLKYADICLLLSCLCFAAAPIEAHYGIKTRAEPSAEYPIPCDSHHRDAYLVCNIYNTD